MIDKAKNISRKDIDLFLIYESNLLSIYSSANESYEDMQNILEQNSKRLMTEFNIVLDSKIQVEIYPDLVTYHKNMWEGLTPNVDFQCNDQIIGNMDESTNSIKIVTPYNPGPIHNYNTVVKTVLHEFVHVLTMSKFKAENSEYTSESFMKVMWLHEAIAVYESKQYQDFMPVFLKKITEKMPEISDLNDMLLRYIVAWSFAEFMIEKHSKIQLLDLMTNLEIDMDLNKLESEWQEWLKQKYIQNDKKEDNLAQPTTLEK